MGCSLESVLILEIIDVGEISLHHKVASLLFVCYKTRADTAMSLRQARQKSGKMLGKGELPEKPTS